MNYYQLKSTKFQNSLLLLDFCCGFLPNNRFKNPSFITEKLKFKIDDNKHIYFETKEKLLFDFFKNFSEFKIKEIDIDFCKLDNWFTKVIINLKKNENNNYILPKNIKENDLRLLKFHFEKSNWKYFIKNNKIIFLFMKNIVFFPDLFNPPTNMDLKIIDKIIEKLGENTYCIGIILNGSNLRHIYPSNDRLNMLYSFTKKNNKFYPILEDSENLKFSLESNVNIKQYCYLKIMENYNNLDIINWKNKYELLFISENELFENTNKSLHYNLESPKYISTIRSERYVKELVPNEVFNYIQKHPIE